MNLTLHRELRNLVQAGAVVPKYFSLAGLGDAIKGEEGLDGMGVGRVVVGPVGGDDEVPGPDGLDGVLDERLVGVDGDEAAFEEILGSGRG